MKAKRTSLLDQPPTHHFKHMKYKLAWAVMLPLTQNNRRLLPVTKYAPCFNPIIHRNSVTSNDYKIQIRERARGCPLRSGLNCLKTRSHDYRHRIVLPRSQFSSPDRQMPYDSKQHEFPQFRQHIDSQNSTSFDFTLSISDSHFPNTITFRIQNKTCCLILKLQTRPLSAQTPETPPRLIRSVCYM